MNENGKRLTGVLGSFVVAYLWVQWVLFGNWARNGWQIGAFTALYFLWGSWMLRGKRPVKEAYFWMVCAGFLAGCLGLDRCRAAQGWAVLALHGFAAYWAVCRAGLLSDGATGPLAPLDGLAALLLAPFGGFFLRLRTIVDLVKAALRPLDRRTGRSWLISAGALAAAVPVLLLAAGLLGQADEAFGSLWQSLTGWLRVELSDRGAQRLAIFILSLPVGAYLFGLLASCGQRQEPWYPGAALRTHLDALRQVPAGAVAAVLGAFVGLYLLFFGVQAGHLLAVFGGEVPGDLTAAQYAKEGFFQLCAVMVINFGLLVFAARCAGTPLRQDRRLKGLSLALMAQSLLLAVTAAARLWLYVDRFGLTARRVQGIWGITVLSAGAALAIAAIRRPRKVVGPWLLFTAGTFCLLCVY